MKEMPEGVDEDREGRDASEVAGVPERKNAFDETVALSLAEPRFDLRQVMAKRSRRSA